MGALVVAEVWLIYLTQVLFVREGKEELFHQFEDVAIPLMEEYGGRVLYRLRPDAAAYVSAEEELPYEIHFLSFPSDEQLEAFMSDPRRVESAHLKDESVRSALLVQGAAL